ncbi:hypothetical protein JCM6882_009531 [Rhodosporidiobolus microsporus]
MPAKRTSVVFHSPAPAGHHLRGRKRRKTASSSTRFPRHLNSDGDDAERASSGTDSEYEDEQPEQSSRGSRASSTSAASTRRRSAPSGGRSMSTRRNSLPQRQSLGNALAGSSRPRAASTRRGGGKEDDHLAVTQHPAPGRRRSSKVLSPLPVNHTVPRNTRNGNGNGKGKEREVEDVDEARPAKRPRAPPAPPAMRVTRRMSGGNLDTSSASSNRNSRNSRRDERDEDDDAMIEEDEDEAMEEEEAEQIEDEEAEDEYDEGEPTSVRRGRRPSQDEATDAGESADAEGGEEEWEDEATPEQEELDAAIEAQLSTWPESQLRTLKNAELVELYLTAVPEGSAPTTKDALVRGIVDARNAEPSDSGLTSVSEDGDADSDASPLPMTFREGSPEQSSRRRSGGGPASRNASGGKVIRKRVVLNRKSGVRDQQPTPPHTSDEGDNDGEDDDGNATEVEQARPEEEEEPAASSTRMTRRASQIEMPPPPLPAIRRGHVRTRSNATTSLSSVTEASPVAGPAKQGGSPKARHRVQFDGPAPGAAALLAIAETRPFGSTPVAHRTRGHDRPSSQPGAGGLPPPSNPPRPLRAAKRKAVEKLAKNDKGKGRATSSDEEDDEDEEMDFEGEGDEDGDDVLDLRDDSSDSDEYNGEGDSSLEIIDPNRARTNPNPHRRRKTATQLGRRRSARTAKQLDTPPSDADEESGGETEREDEHDGAGGDEEDGSDVEVETEVTSSHLRRGGSSGGKRGGKIVRLRAVPDDEEQEEDEVMEEDIEMEDDAETNGGIDLANATSKTLLRFKKDELLRLCEEHELPTAEAGATKQKLVDALLEWRDKDLDASSPMSAASSSSSTVSNLSTQTAREETKTQALHAVEHASAKTSGGVPLLMRPDHPISPEKPRTPEHSKEHEHQEDVNALDLESLQLQDKEIQPEKLTKLESIGSGGFKDVYKGKYRNQTIAICDIRGHLTDMDIKELGLLRDLRNENIVHFIGVSIPRQPSPVPVMIITELCANGDLFDYIRKTTPPPFVSMLEIMLGIARGIEYLHTRKPTIIHRDIKSSNVLITGKGVAKIADFGLARIKTSTKSMIRSLVGTVNWQAPELWSPHPRYNEKVDVYSVGLVFWEILQWHQAVKRYPFEGQNEHAIYHDVGVKQMRPPTGPLRRQWGGEIVDLISEMWDQDSSKRPPMTKVVQYLSGLVAAEKKSKRR